MQQPGSVQERAKARLTRFSQRQCRISLTSQSLPVRRKKDGCDDDDNELNEGHVGWRLDYNILAVPLHRLWVEFGRISHIPISSAGVSAGKLGFCCLFLIYLGYFVTSLLILSKGIRVIS